MLAWTSLTILKTLKLKSLRQKFKCLKLCVIFLESWRLLTRYRRSRKNMEDEKNAIKKTQILLLLISHPLGLIQQIIMIRKKAFNKTKILSLAKIITKKSLFKQLLGAFKAQKLVVILAIFVLVIEASTKSIPQQRVFCI